MWFITTVYVWRFALFILTLYTQYQFLHLLFYEFNLSHHHLLFNGLLSLSFILLLYLDKKVHYHQRNLFNLANVRDADLLRYTGFSKKGFYKNKDDVDLMVGERHHFRDKNLLKKLLNKVHALDHEIIKKAETKALGCIPTVKKRNHLFFQNFMMVIVVTFLIALNYARNLPPANTKIRKTTLFTLEMNYFSSIQVFIWIFSTKLQMFLALSLWFFSCKFWWRYAILVPFSVITFQLIALCNNNSRWVDETEIWFALPLITPLIIFMVWISKKINYYLRTWELRMFLEKEIQSLVIEMASMPAKNNFKEELNYLMEHKRNFTLNAYLKKLKVLKDKFHKD